MQSKKIQIMSKIVLEWRWGSKNDLVLLHYQKITKISPYFVKTDTDTSARYEIDRYDSLSRYKNSPRGYSHEDLRGCAVKMGLFLQEIPEHGSHFSKKKSLPIGLIFKIFNSKPPENHENLVCFCCKIARNGYGTFFSRFFFFGKISRYGYLFFEKLPLNMGMDLELSAAHPLFSKGTH